MRGIDLDKSIFYKGASLRFFEKNEHHVTRTCADDVLLLVFDGVLRFIEDGRAYELHAGQYHIQRHGSYQVGEPVSDAPKYLYVHFLGEWGEGADVLACSGSFDYAAMASYIHRLDELAHGSYTYTERASVFFAILSHLHRNLPPRETLAARIRRIIDEKYTELVSLDELCACLHYSKNYIINCFKGTYHMTPIEYINHVKLRRAMYLLEVTSRGAEEIAAACGFHHYSHFYRLFVCKNGLSPQEWRRRAKLEPQMNYE